MNQTHWKSRETERPTSFNLGFTRATGINSEKNIERRRRLVTQPFFTSITAVLPDFDWMLEQINPYVDRSTYEAKFDRINHLEQSIAKLGYSRTGRPLWVAENAPPDEDLIAVANTAQACLPILQERYYHVVREAPKSEQNQRAFAAFIERFANFNTGIQGLRDHVDQKNFKRALVERQEPLVCALA